MSLALCRQVVSQAPQHFNSSETQAACDACNHSPPLGIICSVTSFDPGMPKAINSQSLRGWMLKLTNQSGFPISLLAAGSLNL